MRRVYAARRAHRAAVAPLVRRERALVARAEPRAARVELRGVREPPQQHVVQHDERAVDLALALRHPCSVVDVRVCVCMYGISSDRHTRSMMQTMGPERDARRFEIESFVYRIASGERAPSRRKHSKPVGAERKRRVVL